MYAADDDQTIGFTVNGEARRCAPGTTLAQLLGSAGAGRRPVAIECNGQIVPRSQHAATAIRAGDHIEVVGAVGGG